MLNQPVAVKTKVKPYIVTEISSNGHEIIVLPFYTTAELYAWIDSDIASKKLLYMYVLRNIKWALKNNWKTVELFKLRAPDTFAKLDFQNYAILVEKMQRFFITQEEYESANYCKDVLHQYHLQNLIDPK